MVARSDADRDRDESETAGLPSPESQFLVRQANRTAVQTLELPLAADWTVDQLRDGKHRLAQTAAKQQLRVLEPPLATLYANPAVDPPEIWTWKLLQPVSGHIRSEGLDEEIGVGRTYPGNYVQTVTTEGVAGLDRLYHYLFHDYLPRYKHRLTRPCIYHRASEGLEPDGSRQLLLVVFLPVMLSLVRGELGPSVSDPVAQPD